jgi:Domain of unknown function (DUF4381)
MIASPAAKLPAASITQLKDIPLPPPVSYSPQTAGWWVLGAIVLAVLLWIAFRQWRTWRRNRYRRAAQAELDAIAHAVADPRQRAQALTALPALVKRTVLAWAPRQAVAPMTGEAWLAYLDRTLAGENFSRGPGRHLETLAYGDGNIRADDFAALMTLLHRWIDNHVPA